jgi:hypothetical protein
VRGASTRRGFEHRHPRHGASGCERSDHLYDRFDRKESVNFFQTIHALPVEASFAVRHTWSGYNFEPYHPGDPLLIIKATKRG